MVKVLGMQKFKCSINFEYIIKAQTKQQARQIFLDLYIREGDVVVKEIKEDDEECFVGGVESMGDWCDD